MTRLVDLHTHTTASDGTMTPAEVVVHARLRGLSAVAITDHDTAAGLPEALETGAAVGVEVVPGIEISVDWRGRASTSSAISSTPPRRGSATC